MTTTAQTDHVERREARGHRRRAVVASTVGTTIEWYDFFLYGTASAVIFPALFFSKASPAAGILLSFGTQFVGFAARPVGAAIFGHYGDRIGRKATLVATLLLMGLGTALIGVLPTYASIGIWAPILLTLLRLVQGIGVGGEWGGSVLIAMEWSERRNRGLVASWPQVGVPLGLVASNGMVQWITHLTGTKSFNETYWRVPFLVSALLILIGLWVRLSVLESPDFAALKQEQKVHKLPVWQVLRTQPVEVLTSAFVRLSEQAPFYIFVTFVLSYGATTLKLNRSTLLNDVLIAAAIGLVSVPFWGWMSDLVGRRLMYGIGIVGTAAYAFPYFGLLNTKSSGLVLLAIILSLLFHDMQYGPQASLIAENFGTDVRYSGAGLGYQFASVIAGGPAPLIAAAILQHTHSSTWISWYMIGCCVLAMIALVAMPRRVPAVERTPGGSGGDRSGVRPTYAG